jgi:cell division protein ZapA (FtsZ GTPase activity inhibitor)
MEKHNLEVNILGSSFTIRSSDDQEYLKQLVAYLEHTVRTIRQRYDSYDPIKVALLAGLNIADELFRCRSAQRDGEDSGAQEIERIATRLIETIDRSLAEN